MLDKNIKSKLLDIDKELISLYKDINIKKIKEKLYEIEKKTIDEHFWNRSDTTKILGEQNFLKNIVTTFDKIYQWNQDLLLTYEMLLEDFDKKIYNELSREIIDIENYLHEFKIELSFEKKDNKNTYMEINPGEGGLDAKDFSKLIVRMYLRWIEKNKFSVKIIEYDQDIKSGGLNKAILFIKGKNIYGKLKGEHGIHRLIRKSPFNSLGKRQTSFVAVTVIPEYENEIQININDKDLKIDTYKSGGAGGQSVNTTDSAVRIKHIPTGIVVTCQNERSQLQNKESALKILKNKLIELEINEKEKKNTVQKNNIGFGQQIRTYTMHPYSLVKDHRTLHEDTNIKKILDGNIEEFLDAFIKLNNKKIEDIYE